MSNTFAQAHDPLSPPDRRLYFRQPIKSLAYVALDEGNGGIVLNISEGGFSVQAVTSLMDDVLPGVRFQLSESDGWVEANARITWTDQSRKLAGLEFVDLPEDTRHRIREWLIHETTPPGPPGDAGAPSEERAALAVERDTDKTAISSALVAEPAVVVGDQSEERHKEPQQDSAPLVQGAPVIPVALVTGVVSASPRDLFTHIRATDRESQPLPTAHRAEAQPDVTARLFHNKWALTGLVALLAVGSLAAGWGAGQGEFGKFLQRAQKLAPQNGMGVRDVVSGSTIPASRINEIEVENTSNQRWTIPFDGPLNNPEDGTRLQTSGRIPSQARKSPTGFRTWILTPPLQARTAADSSEALKEIPPSVASASGSSENALVSGPIGSQSLAAPPVLRVPDPPPTTEIVKPGRVIHRVDPVYPTVARNLLVEGTVKLNVTIGADGTVRGVALLGGPRLLIEAAETAVRQWRYSPSTIDGRPIEFQQEVDLRFHLSETSH